MNKVSVPKRIWDLSATVRNQDTKGETCAKGVAKADSPIGDVISDDEPHFMQQRKKESSRVLGKFNVLVIVFHLKVW